MSTISNYSQITNNRYAWSSYASAGTRQSTNADMLSKVGLEKDNSRSIRASETLDKLVSSGTITEDQEIEIKEAMEAAMNSSAYSRFKIQSDSSETTSENLPADPLSSLVEAGTITEDQKTAVKAAFDAERKPGHMPSPPPQAGGSNPFESALSSLVDAGTITGEQKTSIVNALQESFKSSNSQTDTNLIETALKAYKEQNSNLSSLYTDYLQIDM